MNLKNLVSLKMETLDLVLKSILILDLDMIHPLVFMEWTFMLSLKELVKELLLEKSRETKLVISKRLLRKMLKDGSSKLLRELLFKTLLIIYFCVFLLI
jgi:ATP sulfurylase